MDSAGVNVVYRKGHVVLESATGCIKHRMSLSLGGDDKLHGLAREPSYRLETTNGNFHGVSRIPHSSVSP